MNFHNRHKVFVPRYSMKIYPSVSRGSLSRQHLHLRKRTRTYMKYKGNALDGKYRHHPNTRSAFCRAIISSSISATICARKICNSRSLALRLVSAVVLPPSRSNVAASAVSFLESTIWSSFWSVWVPSSLADTESIVLERARNNRECRILCLRFWCSKRLYWRLKPLLLRGHDVIGQVKACELWSSRWWRPKPALSPKLLRLHKGWAQMYGRICLSWCLLWKRKYESSVTIRKEILQGWSIRKHILLRTAVKIAL